MTAADFSHETDMDSLAAIAFDVVEKIRDDDRTELFAQLCELCHQHPVKAAQLLMLFVAWFDDAPDDILEERVRSITHPGVDWYAVELVCRERLWRVGRQLNRLERREVIARLSGTMPDPELGALLGMSGDAVCQARRRMARAAS